jgi:O-methyltransferase
MSSLAEMIRIRTRVSSWRQRQEHTTIYRQFKDFTMIDQPTYIANLELARRVRKVSGCVVECGVWRGGMSAGIASVLGNGREYFLFDSFEGLPQAKEIDGKAALEWQGNKNDPRYLDNCSAPPDFAQKAMTMAGTSRFHLHPGWFDKTLPGFTPPGPIALLRLDGDWYDSTMTCLDHLFDHVPPNGMIILDDYYTWDGCSRATHDFLAKRSAMERIRNRGDVCYIVKQ